MLSNCNLNHKSNINTDDVVVVVVVIVKKTIGWRVSRKESCTKSSGYVWKVVVLRPLWCMINTQFLCLLFLEMNC